MNYRVIIRPAVEKFILKLDESDYRAVIERLHSLEETPRPRSVKKLTNTPLWRIRVRDFRIVYSIDDKEKVIRILRITRRGEDTYKNL